MVGSDLLSSISRTATYQPEPFGNAALFAEGPRVLLASSLPVVKSIPSLRGFTPGIVNKPRPLKVPPPVVSTQLKRFVGLLYQLCPEISWGKPTTAAPLFR